MTWTLTDDAKAEYLKSQLADCPRCANPEVPSVDRPVYLGIELHDKIRCSKCGLVWYDVYVLKDIVIDEEQSEDYPTN